MTFKFFKSVSNDLISSLVVLFQLGENLRYTRIPHKALLPYISPITSNYPPFQAKIVELGKNSPTTPPCFLKKVVGRGGVVGCNRTDMRLYKWLG